MSEQYIVEGVIKAIVLGTENRGEMLLVISPTDDYKLTLPDQKKAIALCAGGFNGATVVIGENLLASVGNVAFAELLTLKNGRHPIRFKLESVCAEACESKQDVWAEKEYATLVCGIDTKEKKSKFRCNAMMVL